MGSEAIYLGWSNTLNRPFLDILRIEIWDGIQMVELSLSKHSIPTDESYCLILRIKIWDLGLEAIYLGWSNTFWELKVEVVSKGWVEFIPAFNSYWWELLPNFENWDLRSKGYQLYCTGETNYHNLRIEIWAAITRVKLEACSLNKLTRLTTIIWDLRFELSW